MTNVPKEKLWVKDPAVLVNELENLWPFEKSLTAEEQATRMIALTSLGASLYTQNMKYLYYGLGGLASVLLLYRHQTKLDDPGCISCQ